MVRRNTWIMLVVFIIVGGFVFIFQRYQANQATNTATQTPTVTLQKLYAITIAEVDRINIADNTGENITTYRDAQTINWVIDGIPIGKLDSTKIESNNTQLLGLSVKESLTEDPPLDAVGLDTPAYTITMTTMEGSKVITYVGSVTPTGSGYYIKVDSGPVVIVDKAVIDAAVGMVKNPPLLPTPTPAVTATQTGTPVATQVPVNPTP
jgi:hypothetical protein